MRKQLLEFFALPLTSRAPAQVSAECSACGLTRRAPQIGYVLICKASAEMFKERQPRHRAEPYLIARTGKSSEFKLITASHDINLR
jgi:hypothetical protein